jgi:hypothetical protein
LYNGCRPEDVAELVEQHIVKGTLVRRLIQPIAPSARPAASGADPAPTPTDPDRRSDGDG